MKKFIKTYQYNDNTSFDIHIEELFIDYTKLYTILIKCEQQNLYDHITVYHLSNIEFKMNELIESFVKRINPINLTELEILMNKLNFEPKFDKILK